MILDDIRNIKSSKRDLKKFGITMGIVLAVFGALFLWRQRNVYVVLFGISAFFLFFGLVIPVVLKPIQKVWMSFAITIGWFMSRVLLTILFFIILTPTGLLLRLFGKDFLDTDLRKKKETYWITMDSSKKDKMTYEKQF